MKRFVSFLVLSLVAFNSYGDQAAGRRPAMSDKFMSAPRYTASVNQLNSGVSGTKVSTTTTTTTTIEEEVDMREAERNACLNNNIGIGNTFVWASRYSNTSNYSSMMEDTKHPENNVCFVLVELKSNDESRISVADIEPKYFTWGEEIECGSWVDKKEMEKRILDAKKGVRIGTAVGVALGSAGLGVGAMELFGNKLFDKVSGGKLEGQQSKHLSEEDNRIFYITKMQELQTSDPEKYEEYISYLKTMKSDLESYKGSDNYKIYNILIEEFVDKSK